MGHCYNARFCAVGALRLLQSQILCSFYKKSFGLYYLGTEVMSPMCTGMQDHTGMSRVLSVIMETPK